MREVSADDLYGTWALTEPARALGPPQARRATATIHFERSGSFSACELPIGILGTQPTQQPQVFSGAGTWKLVWKGGRQEIELLFQEMQDSLTLGTPYGARLVIGERKSFIVLFYFDGDPDDQRKVEFQQQR